MKAALSRPTARRPLRSVALGGTAVLAAATLAACSTSSSSGSSSDGKPGASSSGSASGKTINVVAAENFWGSIASQLGGSHRRTCVSAHFGPARRRCKERPSCLCASSGMDAST